MQDTLTFKARSPLLKSRPRERALLLLAAAFVLIGFAQLGVVNPQSIEPALYAAGLLTWAIAFAAAHLVLNRFLPGRDPILLPIVALLAGWGLLQVARLSQADFPRQTLWVAASVVALLAVAAAPRELRWLRRYRYTWLIAGLVLLAATLVFGVNPSGFGQELWLGFGRVFFQPSELIKLLMVVYLASYLAEKRDVHLVMRVEPRTLDMTYLGPMLAMWGLVMAVLLIQQDLGAAVLLFLAFLVMLYLASGRWTYLAIGAGLLAVAVAAGYLLVGRVRERVDTWLNPWAYADAQAYQVVQSLIGVGEGGLLGSGVGQGDPVVPAAHTDMPLAVVGEELGLIGAIGLVMPYLILTLRGLRAAAQSRTVFGALLAAGLATLIGMQAWIIMAGNINLIPLTGITLPLVSYGGSSALVSCVMVGLLLHVSADID